MNEDTAPAETAVLSSAPAGAEAAATTEQPAGAPDVPQQPQPGAFGSPMVIMLLMFAILYFVMIRPQQRKEKERRAQIDALRAGVRVADGVVVEIARGAVERPLPDAKA